jgi:thiol-disulfide isomerase/thioredoxin
MPLEERNVSKEINDERRRFLATAAVTIAGAQLGLERTAAAAGEGEGELASLQTATAWLNSAPLTAAGLRGKVVLVSFWTYSCINWLRSQPYLRAWTDKYRDRGLVVVGVHSPEFGFEKDLDNVRRAAQALRVSYPIAVDSNHAIWDAFDNQYWPALYFIDAKGRIRHHQFGEGQYERSEETIQRLLVAAGHQGVGAGLVSVTGSGREAAADWSSLRSPESYLGSRRRENVGEGKLNHWTLSGDWAVGSEAITLHGPGGKIEYPFHARDLHLVMGPAAAGAAVRFRVRLDGKVPGAAHGLDVDPQGTGQVTEPRLYQLIRQAQPIADRAFEIEFLDPGVEAFVFTFG